MKQLMLCLLWSCAIAVFLPGCKAPSPQEVVEDSFPGFLKEGHRGARGYMPENTIPSMKRAVDDGANVLELDIQISRDKKVVVAHDPYVNREFTLLPGGGEIPEEDAEKYILYRMDYAEIRRFDVGSKYYGNFPQQKKITTYMPLLGELIDSVEQYTARRGLPAIIYNIEIKAKPERDGFYQPAPEELIALVMDVVGKKELGHRFYIQSFDIRQIQEVHKHYPGVVTGFLTSRKDVSFEDNISSIGFLPQIYSPNYSLATPELIDKCHLRGIKFVPWTVNTPEDIQKMKQMGVDGIITDYPDLLD